MAPTPAHLRAAAEALRTTARRLDLDLGPVAEKGDHQTWEGPAATSYRRDAGDIEARGRSITAGLRGIAARLEVAAGEIEQAEAAARARAEEAQVAAERDRAARAQGQAILDRPMWPAPDGPAPTTVAGTAPAVGGDLLHPGGGGHG